MNGMIFAAGLGTRLRPLTNDRPKALVELQGKTLLERVISRMKEAGISRIVVNVHHYADQIENFLKEHHYSDMEILISDERQELMDTGGGLWKARSLFEENEPVLIHNVDILTALDLRKLIQEYETQCPCAILAVRPSAGGRVLKFNTGGDLKGWENLSTGEQKIVDQSFYTSLHYSFCGIQIVSPDLLNHFLHEGVFSIIDEYLLQARTQAIKMFYYPDYFMDLGTPEAIQEAEKWLKEIDKNSC